MPRSIWSALGAAAAFAAILISRLPASWVVPRTGMVVCSNPDGSVWSGSCSGLSIDRLPFGDVSWDVAPLPLLTGTLAAHVVLAHGPATGSADVAYGIGGRIALRDVVADVKLDPRLIPHVPPQLRGSLHTELALVRLEHGALADVAGRIEARDLSRRTGHVTPLGSYALSFPGGGEEPVGTLEDLGGPLAVRGTLRLTRQPGYVLEATVAPRDSAPPELLSELQFLGSPDAMGRRPLSIAGSL